MKNWFDEQFKKYNLAPEERYLTHTDIAKVKRLPSFEKTKQKGKLILVSAMSPTPSGEGKTTTVIALTDALNKLQLNAMATLRQPSVGPVFGKKGGATGGGKASVVPKDQIDLGLSGDFYAVEAANNMIAALIDNHIFHNQKPYFHKVLWKRCLDINDRSLRNINFEHGAREFVITAASELMAILSLSRNFKELKENIGNVILGIDENDKYIYAKDLGFHKVAAVLLRDSFYPNLVKTLENSPVLMHAGPFANIAQGTCSILSTALALELNDYVVTEAGFGADLGAEKFFNIKNRKGQFEVACTVIVATTKAIQKHGIDNLLLHIENCQKFHPRVVVSLNQFAEDTSDELKSIMETLKSHGIACEICNSFQNGSSGALELAKTVVKNCQSMKSKTLYENDTEIKKKIEIICKEIYRAKAVDWSPKAQKSLAMLDDFSQFPVCMAKSPLSINENNKIPFEKDKHIIHITDIIIQAGAGFVVALTGEVNLLPGLPIDSRALHVDLDDDGKIVW